MTQCEHLVPVETDYTSRLLEERTSCPLVDPLSVCQLWLEPFKNNIVCLYLCECGCECQFILYLLFVDILEGDWVSCEGTVGFLEE
jgi:hypothetical protein